MSPAPAMVKVAAAAAVAETLTVNAPVVTADSAAALPSRPA